MNPRAARPRLLPSLSALVALIALAGGALADDRAKILGGEARPVDALEIPAPPPAPAARCTLAERPGDPPGLYRTDPFPAGEIVLTFDDGPHPRHTPRVLDLLAKHHMPATFFVIGRNIHAGTFSLLQRMVREGHTLASHSYNHDVAMASRASGEPTIAYVRAQHEATRVLIELALLATSPEDFDAMFVRVFGGPGYRHLSGTELRAGIDGLVERHAALLAERSPDARPYPLLLSRPPGGNPFVGGATLEQKRAYGAGLARVGLLNVLWHAESGDTHATRKTEAGFLRSNLRRGAKHGGVILIHDYMRRDVLAAALDEIAADPTLRVVPIEGAVTVKFGCGSGDLARALGGD